MQNADLSYISNWRKFWRDQNGSSLPLFGLAMLVVIASAALGIDYSRAVTMRKLLTNATDAAALAAASRLPDAAAARAAAILYVEKNLPPSEYGTIVEANDVEIGEWDRTTRKFTPNANPGADGSAVRVTALLSEARGNDLPMFFGSVLGTDSLDLSARAVAGRGGPPCVIALDPGAVQAMNLRSATFTAISCGVQVNSKGSPALAVDDNSSLEATDICVGGSSSTGTSSTPEPRDYCPGQPDPLAGLAAPAVGACDHNSAEYMKKTATIDPGVYCGGIWIANGSDITLSAGTYIIKDGPLEVSGSTVRGTGVTIFLTGPSAIVDIYGKTSQLDLTAPTAGDLKGMLFFQDRAYGGTHNWAGKAATNLRGVIYFPKASLYSKNDNAITPEDSCTVIIVKAMEFASGSGATINLSSKDCRGGLAGPYSRGIVLLD